MSGPKHSQPWPRHPLVYEINTWVWLEEIGRRSGRHIDLGSVPPGAWEEIAKLGFDAVWLMGVWERSPEGIRISQSNPDLVRSFQAALPDFVPSDNTGSPYCVRRYVVEQHLGGPEGLAVARERLAAAGLRLLLDFVPNHVAPDHPWAVEHPEYFILGTEADLERDPASFAATGGRIIAHGRDPYFPAWPDVLQLNAFSPGLRTAAMDTLQSIAQQCDGVRCDMAMLVINSIFRQTWGARAGSLPAAEYWMELIPALRERHPAFLFIAEAYWDREWDLQQQGFDYCYDKRLYDRLNHETPESVRAHLAASLDYQSRLVRFLENHDEPRAAATFPPGKHQPAAAAVLTLPGMRLLHEGQLEGRRTHLPVFLARHSEEPVDAGLRTLYIHLLEALRGVSLDTGEWRLLECKGWPDNHTNRNLLSWLWKTGDRHLLVAINLSEQQSQCRVAIPDTGRGDGEVPMRDIVTDQTFFRSAGELRNPGLFVDLPPWGFHLLDF